MSAAKVNRAKVLLFVLGATLGNLALMAGSFALLMVLYSVLLAKILPPESLIWAIAVAFLLALVVSTLCTAASSSSSAIATTSMRCLD